MAPRHINGIGAAASVSPRMTRADYDYMMGLEDVAPAGVPTVPVYSRPLPYPQTRDPGPSLTYDQYGVPVPARPGLRGTIGPDTPIGGAPALRGTIGPAGQRADAAGALPTGKGFAQAVYERGLASGLTDTQARLVASQAALESNHGRSGLSRDANNYFGIKAGRNSDYVSMRTREENSAGGSYYENARFRKYASPEDSFKDHVALLQRKYPDALRADNMADAAAGLRYGQQGGYATDQRYGSKLESIARGLKPPTDPGIGNNPPRPPRDIPSAPPSPMGGSAQPVSNRSNMPDLPPEMLQQNYTSDLVDRHQLTGPAQSYMQTGPSAPMQQPFDVQQFFQPVQAAPVGSNPNAFSGGGNSFDLASFFNEGGGGGGGGGGGDFDFGFGFG